MHVYEVGSRIVYKVERVHDVTPLAVNEDCTMLSVVKRKKNKKKKLESIFFFARGEDRAGKSPGKAWSGAHTRTQKQKIDPSFFLLCFVLGLSNSTGAGKKRRVAKKGRKKKNQSKTRAIL